MADFDLDAYVAAKDGNTDAQTPGPASVPIDQTQAQNFDLDDYVNTKDNENFDKLQAKYGGLGQQAIAGVEGGLSGATLGLSRVLENASGITTPQAQAGRAQANPLTSGGTNLLGGAGLIGLTGGLSAPLEGAGLGAEALGNVGAKALSFGLEGGAFGGGQAVTDYALGDPQLNAQKVLADVGGGALFGGLLGAAAGGAESALGSFGIGKKIADEAASANTVADTAEALNTTANQKEFIPLKQNAQEVLDAGQRQGLKTPFAFLSDSKNDQHLYSVLTNTAPTIAGKIEQNALESSMREVADKVSGILDTGDITPGVEPLTKAQLGESLRQSLISSIQEENAPTQALWNKFKENGIQIPVADGEVANALNAIKKLPRVNLEGPDAAMANRVMRLLPKLSTAEDVNELASGLQGELNKFSSSGHEFKMAASLRDVLSDVFDNSVEKASSDPSLAPEMQEQLKQAMPDLQAAKAATKAFKERFNPVIDQLGGNTDYGFGAQSNINFLNNLDPETFPDKLFDKKFSKFNQFMDEEHPDVSAQLKAYQKAKIRDAAINKDGSLDPNAVFKQVFGLKKIKGMEPEIQNAIFSPKELSNLKDLKTWYGAIPDSANPSRTSFTAALMRFLESPVEATTQNARDFFITGYLKARSLLAENLKGNPFKEGVELGQKVNAMTAVQKIAQRVTDDINNGSKSIFRRTAEGAALSGTAMITDKGYDKLSKQLQDVSANPQKMPDLISQSMGNLPKHIPNISQEMINTQMQGVAFLNSKLPKPQGQMPLSQPFEPSQQQKVTFMKYANAVNNPMSIMPMIKNGTLNQETMEAMQAVHPALLKQIQQSISMQMQKADPAKIPYRVKVSVAKLLGQLLDSNMLPQTIMANQAILSGAAQAQNQQQAAGQPKRRGAMSKLDLSGNTSTTQRDRQENKE